MRRFAMTVYRNISTNPFTGAFPYNSKNTYHSRLYAAGRLSSIPLRTGYPLSEVEMV